MATRQFVLLLLPLLASSRKFPSPNKVEDARFWMRLGMKEIEEALRRPINNGRAKNIIFFLGDGMGIAPITAGRIFKGQKKGRSGEEECLAWERFPNIGLMKTYTVDKQVSDSAGTATAFLTGVKTNSKTVGVTSNVELDDCLSSLLADNRPSSVLHWAQLAGKATGIVTTTRITHATPAALYAHSANRYWESDLDMSSHGEEAYACKDIARQLVEDEPGRSIKVILGGGRRQMGDVRRARRGDGRNLVDEWMKSKESQLKSYKYVTTTKELKRVDVDNTDYLLGLFGSDHTPYEVYRDESTEGTPHIKDMTTKAIQMLQKEDNGFFLLVEGGRIDHGFHDNRARLALEEVVAFDEAVAAALELVDLEETLVIVTADHSTVMTINGYPARGNDIFGTYKFLDTIDGLPWTTLMFTNGPGFAYTVVNGKLVRRNLTGVDTFHSGYRMMSAVETVDYGATHGGEDVAIFAAGPMSHLVHRTHEQNYVAHVMGYAACIGPYDNCDRLREDDENKNSYVHIKNPKEDEDHSHPDHDKESYDIDVHEDKVDDITSARPSNTTSRPETHQEDNGAASKVSSLTSLFLGLTLALPLAYNHF